MNGAATDGDDAFGARRAAPPRRIVFATILADEQVVASIAPADAEPDAQDAGACAWTDPAGLASMPLRFAEHAGPWGVAATLATGATPLRHGVLTAMAIDETSLAPRLRRASDADRPWIWDRFAAQGRTAVVVGWPGILDATGSEVPFATLAAIMAPRRLAMLADGQTPANAPESWRSADPQEILSQLVAPAAAAPDLARAALAAAATRSEDRPADAATRIVETILAAAHALEALAPHDAQRTRLWAIDVPLRNGFSQAPTDSAEALRDDRSETVARAQTTLAATLARLAEAAGEDGVLLAAVIGERTGRLWHSGIATAPAAAAIDLGPTILQLAGLPVSADLPGESLLGKREDTAKSWDIARWSVPDPEGSTVTRRPPAGTIARQALAARRDRAQLSTPDGSTPIDAVLSRHFESEWALALAQPDWEAALSAAQALVELHGREIDLWRVAFAAFQGDRAPALEAAASRLRAEHADSLATRLLPLLASASPPRELVESFDLAELRIPTQRSIVGRCAARLGLDEIGRKALAPLVAQGVAIPADRIALANILLRLGEGARAVAALGGIGLGAESPGRLRMLRARCLAAAGRREQAISLLERHLLQSPFDGEARTLRDRIARGDG